MILKVSTITIIIIDRQRLIFLFKMIFSRFLVVKKKGRDKKGVTLSMDLFN